MLGFIRACVGHVHMWVHIPVHVHVPVYMHEREREETRRRCHIPSLVVGAYLPPDLPFAMMFPLIPNSSTHRFPLKLASRHPKPILPTIPQLGRPRFQEQQRQHARGPWSQEDQRWHWSQHVPLPGHSEDREDVGWALKPCCLPEGTWPRHRPKVLATCARQSSVTSKNCPASLRRARTTVSLMKKPRLSR